MFQLSSSGAAALKYQGVILGQDIIQVICLCGAPECPRIGFSVIWPSESTLETAKWPIFEFTHNENEVMRPALDIA